MILENAQNIYERSEYILLFNALYSSIVGNCLVMVWDLIGKLFGKLIFSKLNKASKYKDFFLVFVW